MTGCMPRFCSNWPFFFTGLTWKALVFTPLLIAHHVIIGGKTSPGKAKNLSRYIYISYFVTGVGDRIIQIE